MSELDDSLEANSTNPLTRQAENRFHQQGEVQSHTASKIDSRIQMVHILGKRHF